MPLFRRGGPGDGRWIVAGLGNPGPRYAGTRHNVGAMALDALAARSLPAPSLRRHRSGCLTAEVDLAGERAVLARATTYMNESGGQLGQLVRWYKTPVERVVVMHDELDLAFGDVRVKAGGGTAGHNGLKSLVSHLGSKDFVRVRIGIGRPPGRADPVGYVLSDFSRRERDELSGVVERAADAVEQVLAAGVERAMNDFNTRRS